jgi:hypothetical protein
MVWNIPAFAGQLLEVPGELSIGTSPRVRGKPEEADLVIPVVWNIPAPAGKLCLSLFIFHFVVCNSIVLQQQEFVFLYFCCTPGRLRSHV